MMMKTRYSCVSIIVRSHQNDFPISFQVRINNKRTVPTGYLGERTVPHKCTQQTKARSLLSKETSYGSRTEYYVVYRIQLPHT
jgi:hypothetical protein